MEILKVLLIAVILSGMTSCMPDFYCKRCPVTTVLEIKDTVIIKEILKDTTITVYIPPDSTITILMVECDSLGMAQMKEYILRSNNMIVRLKVINGVLTQNITHLMDSLQVTIQYKEREIIRLKERLEQKVKPPEKEKYKGFRDALMWIGLLAILAVVLYFILKRR